MQDSEMSMIKPIDFCAFHKQADFEVQKTSTRVCVAQLCREQQLYRYYTDCKNLPITARVVTFGLRV